MVYGYPQPRRPDRWKFDPGISVPFEHADTFGAMRCGSRITLINVLVTVNLVSLNCVMAMGQCEEIYELGNDTIICPSSVWNADGGEGYLLYEWDNGTPSRFRAVDRAGLIRCEVQQEIPGTNVIENSDFSLGNVGFTTSYVVGDSGQWGPLTYAGTYMVTNDPPEAHGNWPDCDDHSSGAGLQMLVNGSHTPGAAIWCQMIPVEANTNYAFSAWLSSPGGTPAAKLRFKINGQLIGQPLVAPLDRCGWNRFAAPYTSSQAGTVELCITNDNLALSGNDFALDDLSFSKTCTYVDSLEVTLNDVIPIAGTDELLFCDCPIFLPTAFTPNADEHNDTFGPTHDCPDVQHEFWIFDTWGGMVHHAAGLNVDWDGMHSGGPVRPGVYRWELKALSSGRTHVDRKISGHVVLLR